MPLNPPPTIAPGLCIVTQKVLRSDMSRPAEIIFGLNSTDPVTIATAQDVIDDFQANFNAQLGALMDTQVALIPPSMKMGNGTAVPIEVVAAGAAGAGAQAGAFTPPNVACLIKKTTSFGGKKNRGRSYLPFLLLQSAVAENGTIGAVPLAGIQGTATAFLTQLSTDASPMIIVNKTFNTPLPPHFVTALTLGPAVTGYTAESIVATQRRRLGR